MQQSIKKVPVNFIKGIILLFLLVMLVLEAFLTAPFIEYDKIVVYTAVITTLCWGLMGLFFLPYSKQLFAFLFIIASAFFYLYYFDAGISLAHQREKCIDLGYEWKQKQSHCSIVKNNDILQ